MSYIALSESAFLYNASVFSSKINSNKIFAVLKDNAYGHGAKELSKLCSLANITNAAVRTAQEADEIAKYFNTILVLSDDYGSSFDNVNFAINSLNSLKLQPQNRKIHLKIDSGMHRNGVTLSELSTALDIIKQNKLILNGVFSHLRGADELDTTQFWQEQNFEQARIFINNYCINNKLNIPKYHLHNSAGALRKNSFDNYDYIRPGIGLYGYMDSPVLNINLQPVLKLFAAKVSSKAATQKLRFGYGGKGVTAEKSVSIYDIGYADGFWRFNENHSYITPNGSKLLGRVSMDSCFVEGSEDEICLMDSAQYAASVANTISYDLLAKLKPNITRKIVF
ncbi:MAG: alanine racemase [Pseudomonadota bacterium]|jgi:alanine racemase